METLCIKLEGRFARNIEKAIEKHHYTTKTEFVREAIRNRIKDLEREEAKARVLKFYGASPKKTTDEELHRAGERAFEELEKEIT